ncbi:ATP synthase F1 subunit gamma [Candidatus Cardinium hertigii]|uniref:ATP synthase gamma chain n=1 Tax=Candidatus Cardinium hertigii TaxID=247481 RepID=A0A2Z3LBT9_9BACT|nr:ATP synthase F1 subunit gamma [Candidatus Cardinium hertigii]AWN81652.1 ATP synthase gamma chain, sodium ion specific [Candidatus Cardinium hertigii]
MAYLKEVVNRINLITSTQQITKAMNMIAASKLYKIQQLLLPLKEYTMQYNILLQTALQGISGSMLSHPLTVKAAEKPRRLLLIVVTADRGLCGAFNKNVLKAASCYMESCKSAATATIELLVIGKKAYQCFKNGNYPIIDDYVDLLEKDFWKGGHRLAEHCIKTYQEARYTEIVWVYTAFKNAVSQEVATASFLPLALNAYESPPNTQWPHYMYEPTQQLLIAQLIPEVLKNQVMNRLVESMASEHAARMLTMSQATDNADAFLKVLRIHYNRTRQALITNSLAEITTAAEALATR